MNRKKIIITAISVIAMISLLTVSYAAKNKISMEQALQKDKQFETRIKEALAKEDMKKRESNKAKVIERLDKAYKDIIYTYEINENDYKKLDLEQGTMFLNGKMEGYSQEYISEIQSTINDLILNAPTGSTEPFILVKNDNTQIIIAYKESDGKNTIIKLNQDKNNWVSTKETRKGEKIEKID